MARDYNEDPPPSPNQFGVISRHISAENLRDASKQQDDRSSETLHEKTPQSGITSQPRKQTPIIVTINLSDPDHPNNWATRKKMVIVLGGIASVLNSTFGSSLPSGAMDAISQHFDVTNDIQLVLPISCYLIGYVFGPSLCGPLSEYYGRRPIMLYSFLLYTVFTMACAVANTWAAFLIFRFLCGCFASAPIAIIGGMYADVYDDPHKRGIALGMFMSATACGPVTAPPIAGFISENTSWRWVFAVGTFFAAATIPAVFMMKECYLPVLMSQKAARLRKETGDENYIAKSNLQKKSFKFVMTVVLTRPYRMLFQELIVSTTCLYLSLAYAIFYLSFSAWPFIFQGPDSVYKWSPGVAGLAFLPIALGSFVDLPIFFWWDAYLARAQKRQAKWAQIEEYRRLPFACVGGPIFAFSLLWIGWSARPGVHWIIPVSSGVVFGMGFLLIFQAFLNYIADAYKTFAASASSMTSICRSIFGATVPLAASPMFRKLGIAWACSLLAFLSLALSVLPFVFIRFGDTLRANSKFCQRLKEVELQEKQEEETRLRELGRGPSIEA